MPKFTNEERTLIKSIVATLSIKRIPDPEIIKEIYEQTKKSITRITNEHATGKLIEKLENEGR